MVVDLSDETAPEPTRVLVVDNEPSVRRLLGAALRAAGFGVTFASDGAEALREVAAGSPDVVVCELLLPDGDGLAVVEGLAEMLGTAAPPVIVLSVHNDHDSLRRVIRAGAADFVSKPFSPYEIVERVRVAAARAALAQEAGT
jgi:CheY-like chemotaxis protein